MVPLLRTFLYGRKFDDEKYEWSSNDWSTVLTHVNTTLEKLLGYELSEKI